MMQVLEIPVEAGGQLLVQVHEDDIPDGIVLAAVRPGVVIAQASQSLEASLEEIRPAITAVTNRLRALAADEVSVEFGLVLGAEAGVVVAKGSAEVHFTVTLSWKRADTEQVPEPGTAQAPPASAAPDGGNPAQSS